MKLLPVRNNLKNAADFESESLSGDLVCDCGCDLFAIRHSGRQAKWSFGRPITSDGKIFFIAAVCSACSRKFILHWSEPDLCEADEAQAVYADFFHRRVRDNRWHVRLEYEWFYGNGKEGGEWSSAYNDVTIEIRNDKHPRSIRLYE